MAGIPVKYSATPGTVRLPPPLLGEHTEEILSEILGLERSQITELREAGAI
jgi:crotonobetainyl-CoA:carnitine CoA-transferase CaiB-like acyl-CoA transferase